MIRIHLDRGGYRELKSLRDIEKFATNDLIPKLTVPDERRAIFDGRGIYLEKGGAITVVKDPLFSSEEYRSGFDLYIKGIVLEFNHKIKEISESLKESS